MIVVVTVTVPVRPFAPVIVIVVVPAVDPEVTVKRTVPPGVDGDVGCSEMLATAGFVFEIVNAPPYPLSLTVKYII